MYYLIIIILSHWNSSAKLYVTNTMLVHEVRVDSIRLHKSNKVLPNQY